MNSSPRTVLRGAFAAQAVTYTPDAPTAHAQVRVEPTGDGVLLDEGYTVPPSAVPTSTAGVVDVSDVDGPGAPLSPVEATESSRSGARVHFDQVYAEQMAILREEARRDGFETGHAEGMAAAEQAIAEMVEAAAVQAQAEQDAWRAQAQAALAALAAAAAAFDVRTAPALEEMTESLSGAAYTLVGDLFARELAVATEPGRDAVNRALRLVPADQPAIVRLNPDDFACLDPEWVASLRTTVTLLADPTVEPSGAVAESGARRVDAQLSTALERVREVLTS